MSAPDDRDIDDISAIDECASCGWEPAAIVLIDGDWECYNCGQDFRDDVRVLTDGGEPQQSGSERSPRDLSWGSPQLGPGNCYGEHDPVALEEQVVCAVCGAEAETANPEDWPDADEELRSLLADDSLRADGGPEQVEEEYVDEDPGDTDV